MKNLYSNHGVIDVFLKPLKADSINIDSKLKFLKFRTKYVLLDFVVLLFSINI